MSEVKLLLIVAIGLFIGLMGLGIFVSSQGGKTDEAARSARAQQMEMFNMAIQQAQQAQEMARMQMEFQRAAMEEAYGMEYEQVGYEELSGH
ncbi:MAG: hypothetical protein ACYTGC_17090 [Planctomycetota bacterium]